MDATTAMNQTNDVVTGVIAGLTADQRDTATPCAQWNVHDLLGHMCSGGHMVAGALQGQAPPAEPPDFLVDGPVSGWAGTASHLAAAATPEALAATHQMPFGEVPGEVALAAITADALTHAWDLAQASGQDISMGDDLAEWALATWQAVVPAEGRTGDAFAAVVPVPDQAPAMDRLVGYTGRQP